MRERESFPPVALGNPASSGTDAVKNNVGFLARLDKSRFRSERDLPLF